MTTNKKDIPGSRRAIEYITAKFYVFSLLVFALMGSSLFVAGMIQAAGEKVHPLDALAGLSESASNMVIGMACFVMFFPIFMVSYFARHFLVSIKRLEQENQELRRQLGAQEGK